MVCSPALPTWLLCCFWGKVPISGRAKDPCRPLLDLRPSHIQDPDRSLPHPRPYNSPGFDQPKAMAQELSSSSNAQCSSSPASEGEHPPGTPPTPSCTHLWGPAQACALHSCLSMLQTTRLAAPLGVPGVGCRPHTSQKCHSAERRDVSSSLLGPPYPGEVSRGAGLGRDTLCSPFTGVERAPMVLKDTLQTLPLREREMSGAGCSLSRAWGLWMVIHAEMIPAYRAEAGGSTSVRGRPCPWFPSPTAEPGPTHLPRPLLALCSSVPTVGCNEKNTRNSCMETAGSCSRVIPEQPVIIQPA